MAQPLPAEEIESPPPDLSSKPHSLLSSANSSFLRRPGTGSSMAAAWQQHGSSIAEDNWLVVYLPSFEKYMVKKCG